MRNEIVLQYKYKCNKCKLKLKMKSYFPHIEDVFNEWKKTHDCIKENK